MIKKSFLFFALIFVFCSRVRAQVLQPDTLQMLKLHPKPIVELTLNGKKSSFLVDTGSDITILNLKDAERYSFKTVEREGRHQVRGMGGKSESLSETWNVQLEAGGRQFLSSFLSYDLSPIVQSIREKTGISISGILGADLMKKYGFLIDFAQKQIIIPNLIP